jgi:2-epi-5-epi-valiolone 7-phosphate 2-epimerase
MIKCGVCQWSVDGAGVQALARAAELGFTAIHLDAGPLDSDLLLDDPARLAAHRQAARESGVQIGAVSPSYLNDYGPTNPPSSESARRCQQLIEIAIGAAAQLGAPLVFVPSFRAGEIRDDTDLRRTAEVLQAACDLAAPHGLLVASENTLGVEGNLRLLELTGRDNLQVLLDTQNPVLWGHDTAALTAELWPHLSDQVHVKDGHDGQMGNAALGAGQSGFAATAAVLKAHGFAGTFISENDYLGENAGRAAQDLAALAALFPAD